MDGSDAHHTHVIIIIIERESGVLAFFRHHNTDEKDHCFKMLEPRNGK